MDEVCGGVDCYVHLWDRRISPVGENTHISQCITRLMPYLTCTGYGQHANDVLLLNDADQNSLEPQHHNLDPLQHKLDTQGSAERNSQYART